MNTRIVSGLVLAALVALGRAAPAQYFGRNKVQYEDFRFRVLETEHFDIYHYPEETQAVELAGRMAERWYARLSRLLDHELNRRQPIILYASHPHFEQTNAILGDIGEGTGGVTELLKRRVVLPFAGPLAETDHVLGHELAHAFQFDMTGDPGRVSESNAPVALRMPLWFIEGMAEYLSVGPVDPHTAMWMRDALRDKNGKENLPGITKLNDQRYFPYRWGQALWSYIAGTYGDDAVGRILKSARRTRDPYLAIERIIGIPIDSLSKNWHAAMQGAFEPLRASTDSASAYGKVVLDEKVTGGRLNIAPAVSPDGQQIVFMSERDQFSVDVFVADAAAGAVRRKLVGTAVDPHFQSLQFINSAGAWDSEGRRFIVGGISDGKPVLSIFDAASGALEREERLPTLDEVFNPSWSPDGRYVAFSAIVGGLSDLFLYDLEADTLLRLTEDPYSDLQPAWRPDGASIAFVTDRYSTDLGTLKTGEYGLAVIDPATREARSLFALSGAKAINPQWGPDGRSIYFLSDRTGVTNVYRLEVGSGEVYQVTNLFTGVSGITALSPALSVATKSGHLFFSAYERGAHNVYRIDDTASLTGKPVDGAADVNAARLPPARRDRGQVVAMLENPMFGLPGTENFKTRPYRAGLSLDYVSDPNLTFGSDRFGTFFGGGASLYWSDMLGVHNVVTMLQVQGSLRDVAVLAGYQNLERRLNWGVAVQQIPYIWGSFDRTFDLSTRTLYEQTRLFRQINRDVTGFAAYPFNRVRRVEFSTGYRHVTFHDEVETVISQDGALIDRPTVELPSDASLHLGTGSAALVYDNALFGWTGPILGQRYRLEASPTVGSLGFVNALADYRRYVMPVRPFTLAGRFMHYGRYGSGADDNRMAPLFLGYPGIIRGYDLNSFATYECVDATATNSCPVFNQLIGSRILVGNAELRFPPLGALGVGPGLFGVLPLDLVAFVDAGVAWNGTEKPEFLNGILSTGGTRDIVTSAGVGLRVNLLGFAIAELDYVKPFDRPIKGTHWQFSFTQAF
ncbi:MAG: PD40 domain-containing protein [Gemmatimonadetes bacterium]|nr:PD40 domain-containing protein [Gemmatimonadota bacterium]